MAAPTQHDFLLSALDAGGRRAEAPVLVSIGITNVIELTQWRASFNTPPLLAVHMQELFDALVVAGTVDGATWPDDAAGGLANLNSIIVAALHLVPTAELARAWPFSTPWTYTGTAARTGAVVGAADSMATARRLHEQHNTIVCRAFLWVGHGVKVVV